MNRELAAQLALAGYALAGLLLVWRQVVRARVGWTVWVLYVIERVYCGLMFHWRANRRSPLPETGPAIVIANHRSPVDPLLVWMNHHFGWDSSRLRIVSFIMAREYYKTRGLQWLCRAVRSIPIERSGRDMEGARAALKVLEDGGLLGLFPEGRINRGDELLEGDTGVAWLALRSRAPVYPVFIHGAPRGRTMVACFLTSSRVRVCYGEPVDLSPYYERRKSQELLREVTDLLMQKLAETGGLCAPEAAETEADDVLPLRQVQ